MKTHSSFQLQTEELACSTATARAGDGDSQSERVSRWAEDGDGIGRCSSRMGRMTGDAHSSLSYGTANACSVVDNLVARVKGVSSMTYRHAALAALPNDLVLLV